MQPVKAGMIHYESLLNGAVDLSDVALCYDALAVEADNDELIACRPKEK